MNKNTSWHFYTLIFVIIFFSQVIFIQMNNTKKKILITYITVMAVLIVIILYTMFYIGTKGITSYVYLIELLYLVTLSGIIPLVMASVYLRKLN